MAITQTLNPIVQRFKLDRYSLQRFFRGVGPETGPVHLTHRRVFILPTKRGLFFMLVAFVMLIGALNYNSSLAYSLTFLLTSLGIIAILHTYRNLLGLKIDTGPIPPVFCGEEVHVPVMLENHHHSARYALRLHFPRFSEENRVITDVPENQWIRVETAFPALARGRHPLYRLTLRTMFPLGMFQAWAYAQLNTHYLVYPAPDSSQPLPQDSLYHFNLSGDRGSGTDDFAGLRNYHPGDSLRHIHWKSFARERGLHTKQFGGDRAEELWLDWNTLDDLETEARLSRLTRWILDADARHFNYGLRLPGQVIPLGHGPEHKHRCLEALALFPQGKAV